jgi:hypothetical protein
MSDVEHNGDEQQMSMLTTEERITTEVLTILGRHGLVTPEGTKDVTAVADMVYPTISKAVADTPADRAKVGVTPTALMAQFFADVPGPATWAEYDEEDAEFHEAVYRRLKGEIFRVLSVDPDGPVQSQLGANGGLVLCRMKGKQGREELAYVTRHRKAIDEDNNAPAVAAANRALAKAAARTALAVERVPEHGKWFNRQYSTGTKEGIEAGKNKILGALEAAETHDYDDPGDE